MSIHFYHDNSIRNKVKGFIRMQNKYDYYAVGCGTNFTQFYHSIRFIYRKTHYCNTKTKQ